jgi:hypothetical protein
LGRPSMFVPISRIWSISGSIHSMMPGFSVSKGATAISRTGSSGPNCSKQTTALFAGEMVMLLQRFRRTPGRSL